MKLFYMTGSNNLERNFKVFYLDLKKPSECGTTFITMYTSVDYNFNGLEDDSSSVELRLDLHRPNPSGDAKCKVFKGI